ncbi:MAG: MGMT family protein [Patescibacteria group bacterium]
MPDKSLVTPFAHQVYSACRKVPKGRVVTYKGLAILLGKPGASRAVGNALHRNPYAPEVPCHRVIRSNGQVGGFAGGKARKLRLLREEGIVIKDGRIDLKKYLYNFKPTKNLP